MEAKNKSSLLISKKMIFRTSVMLLSLLGLLSESSAVLLLSFTGTQIGQRALENETVGSAFTVGSQALQVTALGYENSGLDGLDVSHQVGIWNSDGSSLLASVTVPSGTSATLKTQWRFVDLGSPIVLSANTSYVIGANVTLTNDPWTDSNFNDGGGPYSIVLANNSAVSVTQNRYQDPSGFQFPSNNGGGDLLRWAPGNMEFTVILEPAEVGTLLGGAILAVVLLGRRFRQVKPAR